MCGGIFCTNCPKFSWAIASASHSSLQEHQSTWPTSHRIHPTNSTTKMRTSSTRASRESTEEWRPVVVALCACRTCRRLLLEWWCTCSRNNRRSSRWASSPSRPRPPKTLGTSRWSPRASCISHPSRASSTPQSGDGFQLARSMCHVFCWWSRSLVAPSWWPWFCSIVCCRAPSHLQEI